MNGQAGEKRGHTISPPERSFATSGLIASGQKKGPARREGGGKKRHSLKEDNVREKRGEGHRLEVVGYRSWGKR